MRWVMRHERRGPIHGVNVQELEQRSEMGGWVPDNVLEDLWL